MAHDLFSTAYFGELKKLIQAEVRQFEQLGFFDTTFGVRVLPDRDSDEQLHLLEFDTFSCNGIRQVPNAALPDGVDFVLEAPLSVWREMLSSVGERGRIDAAHSINTLTHHDDPIRVASSDPLGHDKLFRFSESVQLVFDLAGRIGS